MHLPYCTHSLEDVVSCFLGCLLLAEVGTLLGLLMVLHVWQNMTAELTLFADRQFYTVSDL